MLQCVQVDRIGHARITNNGVSAEGETAGWCNQAAAPVSKTVTIAFQRDRRLRHRMIWTLEIGETREVHVERYNHRHRLWKVEAEFAPDVDTHDVSISRFGGARCDEEFFGHRVFATLSFRYAAAPIDNHRPGIFVHSMSNFIRAAPS